MKKFLFLMLFVLNARYVLAYDVFLDYEWWKNATLEDVKKEIEDDADVNAQNGYNMTVLMFAEASGDPQIIKFLVDKGANVNARDWWGNTVLENYALTSDHPEFIRILIDAGAKVNVKDYRGATPLMKVVGAKDNIQTVQTLIDAGADVNARDNVGRTALMIAAAISSNHPEIIELLLNAGADINAKDNDGLTALMHARKNILGMNNRKTVKLLENYHK